MGQRVSQTRLIQAMTRRAGSPRDTWLSGDTTALRRVQTRGWQQPDWNKARITVGAWGLVLPEIVWQKCVDCLQEELPSQQFNTWIRPLRAEAEGAELHLFAPNRFVKEWVHDKFMDRISELIHQLDPQSGFDVVLDIASNSGRRQAVDRESAAGARIARSPRTRSDNPGLAVRTPAPVVRSPQTPENTGLGAMPRQVEVEGAIKHQSYLVDNYTFDLRRR